MKSTKKCRRNLLCALLLLIIYLPTTSAQDYYADVTIDVDTYGFVTIDGTTNYPELLVKNTENYTSKKQSYWLLNITKNENFTGFAVKLAEKNNINRAIITPTNLKLNILIPLIYLIKTNFLA